MSQELTLGVTVLNEETRQVDNIKMFSEVKGNSYLDWQKLRLLVDFLFD